MEHPRDHGIPCEHCGLVSSAKLQSCEHRPHGACPYEPQAKAPRPASIPGLLMMAMGVVFLFVFGSLPFLLFPKGDTPVSGVLAGILALTFVFTISSIFILAGAAFTGLRKSLFHNRAQSRLVEIFSIFGIPLAHRMITLGEVIPFEFGASSLPLSLAGFLMDRPLSVIPPPDWESPPEVESKTLSKLKSINAQLDRSISHALLGAILHLAARSCIVFRSARQEIFSRWYTTPSLATYYIQAGEGSSDGLGLLEADLLNKVLNWRSQEWKVDDTVAPTFPDLIKTFRDSDGDFSAYQIRKLLLADGEARHVIHRRSEGLLGRLAPKIEPAAEAARQINEAQEILEDAARRLFSKQAGLGNSLSLALQQTVYGKHGKAADPLGKQNAVLRKRLLYYVISISFALALVLCGIAVS